MPALPVESLSAGRYHLPFSSWEKTSYLVCEDTLGFAMFHRPFQMRWVMEYSHLVCHANHRQNGRWCHWETVSRGYLQESPYSYLSPAT